MQSKQTTILDCGHEPTPTDTGLGTGVARGPDDSTMCYACAKNSIIRNMMETGKGLIYMNGIGSHVCTWDGQKLGRVLVINRSRGNFGDTRVYFRFLFRDTGEVWTGMGQGAGMYCRVRRTKLKSVFA